MSVPAAYITVILIWSTTPLAIQWSAAGAGYAFAVLARMLIGVALAGALLAAWRTRLPLHARARRSYLAGGLGLFGAMALTYWGAQHISSGLVSVLFGLAPLVTSLIAAAWLGEAALRPARLAGMLLGLLGLAVIFHVGWHGGPRLLAGMGALLGAVIIHSASLVWMKAVGDDSPPLATTAGSLLVSLPPFALLWWLEGAEAPAVAATRAWAAIAYLGVFGSVLGFALYYYMIRRLEAGQVALITLMTPVLALLLGQALNGEAPGPNVWAGTALILCGLALHQWGAAPAGRRGG